MSARLRVSPRQAGDPVPDLRAVRLAHRSMLRDVDRLAAVAEQRAVGHGHGRAFLRCLHVWAECVRAHHAAEDELLWPLLRSAAGPHLDLSELRDDHAALAPALDRLRRAGAAVAAGPDEGSAGALVLELADLRDALHEHVADEEAVVLPVLERSVSVRDWARVEPRLARPVPRC